MSTNNISKNDKRLKRKVRTRKRLSGTADKPRLAVFRSLNHISAQVIDDDEGKTLVSASSNAKDLRGDLEGMRKSDKAYKVGQKLAELCKEKGIETVVFDRSGYQYHGRVAALAEGARYGAGCEDFATVQKVKAGKIKKKDAPKPEGLKF